MSPDKSSAAADIMPDIMPTTRPATAPTAAPAVAPNTAPNIAPPPAPLPSSYRYSAPPDHLQALLAASRQILADEAAAARAPRLDVRSAYEIEPQPVEWLWPQRIAIGKLTLLAGVPGLGKSQLTAFIAAAMTAERPLPCGEGQALDGGVCFLSAEDDAADTIRPRLDAAGADVDRVYIAASVHQDGRRRGLNLQADLALLEDVINRSDTRLIVIDPITSYLGRVDSHKNAEVRSVLEPLAEMAARRRVAILAVTHFSKGAVARAMDRVAGSIAFVAAARAAFMIVRDPNDAERRLFVPIKSNVAADTQGGLAFRIKGALAGNIATSRVEWEEEKVEGSADEILTAIRDADQERSAKVEAGEFLTKLLRDGEMPLQQVREAATAAGLSWASLRRTQRTLGVVVRRRGTPGEGRGAGCWTWSMPQATGADI